MKRCIATLLSLCAVSMVLGQAPFTIVRPADGSKVREKVHFLLPKGSVREGGYVGVFLTYPDASGKPVRHFVEAMVPEAPNQKSKNVEYVLDTKARGIPDGKLTAELVLYVDYEDQPRIVDRSAVELTIANSATIKVPEDGFALRYKFKPGVEYTYDYEQRRGISILSEAQNKMGNRAGELPLESEKVRLLYAIDDVYPGGDALVRIQALPEKGKDYAYLTVSNLSNDSKKYMDYEMSSFYMRISSTGMEKFGSIPAYWPLEGTSGESNRLNLWALFPLPVLPDKYRKPGDTWQAGILDADVDLDKRHELNKLFKADIARGEFLRVEWESGFPCAVLRKSYEEGANTKAGKSLAEGGATFTDEKLSIDETIWFALDRGIVIKSITNITRDRKITVAGGIMGGNRGGSGGAAQGGKQTPPGARGTTGGGTTGPMAPPGGTAADWQGPAGIPPGGKGGSSGGPPPASMNSGRGGRGGATGGGGGQTYYVRQKIQGIFTLEL